MFVMIKSVKGFRLLHPLLYLFDLLLPVVVISEVAKDLLDDLLH